MTIVGQGCDPAIESARIARASDRVGQWYMVLAMAISGTIGFFVTISSQAPYNVVFFRCAIGACGLTLYCLSRGYFRNPVLDARGGMNLLLGATTLIANWYFLFSAYRMTSIGITTVVYNVQPFLLLVAGFLFRRERPPGHALLWLVLSFIGLVILAQPGSGGHGARYLEGILYALIAAALYAMTTLFTRSLSASLRPELIALGHMLIGTVIFLPIADFGRLPDAPVPILAIAALGLVHTTFMYILLYGAFKKATTSSLAILGFIYPMVAVAVDFLAFGKVLTVPQISGGVVIVCSAVAYATKFDPVRALACVAGRYRCLR